LTTKRELMSMMRSTSTKWLALSVLPVETKSTMASAKPVSRRQLHAAVELDQVHVHAFGGKEVPRNGDVFGGHFQRVSLV
jgi:hypothetical protein